jgi:hypothetical protein
MPDFGIFRGFNEKLFGDKLYAGQLPINLGLIGSEEVRDFDIDAQAFFDRVTAAGGTLSNTEKFAIDTLVRQMKLDGIWTKMKAIYPMVGASAAACAQNLKSSSFTGTFNGGWTFASTGVKPNGTSAYMNTTFNVASNIGNNNIHLSYYVRNFTSSVDGRVLMGCVSLEPGGYTAAVLNWSSRNPFYYPTIQEFSFPSIPTFPTTITGLHIGRRINSTAETLFINSTKYETNTASNNRIPNNIIYIGSNHSHLGVAQQFTDAECAFSSIGDGLNDTEASNFYTAVQAFQTTLSREV